MEDQLIPSCLWNLTIDTCNLCTSDSALTENMKSCLPKNSFDVNCEVQEKPDKRVCSVCSPGFYFVNKVCTAWSGDVAISNGCFIVD